MTEAKHFMISGEIVKHNLFPPMKFKTEIIAPSQSRAIEKIYTDMGSRHKAKRYQIKILQVDEVGAAEETTKKVDG